jgi:ectoine hydroxylase-related dioxygenase (phytanoyl-CoA dioxygenase family)
MGNSSLSDQQIDGYCRDGYLVVPGFFSSEEMAQADKAIRDVTAGALAGGDYSKVLELEPEAQDGERVPRRIYEPFDQHETFRRIGSAPRLLDCLESLIGPDIAYHYSKINMKPARVGSVVEWHQDMSYYPSTNDSMLAVLIYLDDATEENGCLQVLPRHHTHFFDHSRPDGEFSGMVTEDLTGDRFGRPEALAAGAGSVIFLHCIAPHASLPNRSDRPRRTLIYAYKAADCFPIYFGEMTELSHRDQLLRGKPARFARFGGPAPPIPSSKGSWASLYQLQEESKAKSTGASK